MKRKVLVLIIVLALVIPILPLETFALEGSLSSTSDLSSKELALIYDEKNYEGEFVPGEVLIGLNDSSDATEDTLENELEADVSIENAELLLKNVDVEQDVYLLTLESETEDAVLDAIEELKYDPNIAYAEPNYKRTINETALQETSAQTRQIPNDAYYSDQAGALTKIEAQSAWSLTTGKATVKVGVLDTGVDYNHPDLKMNLSFDPNTASSIMDNNGHGTHVSGIIGAIGNNRIGIAGICWSVTIVPIKIMGDDGIGTSEDLVAGIRQATALGLPIINLSLGDYGYSETEKRAFDSYKGLAVVAAGNSGTNLDSIPTYPANYDCDNILVVANTTNNDTLHNDPENGYSSSYGVKTVDLAAPGTDIWSTIPASLVEFIYGPTQYPYNIAYAPNTGTSMAAPQVAGAAALLLSKFPKMTTAQLKEAILAGVDKVTSLSGKVSTGGRLNINKSFNYLSGERITSVNQLSNTDKYIIRDVSSGGCLAVNEDSTLSPNGIGTNSNEQFYIVNDGDSNNYRIKSARSGCYISVLPNRGFFENTDIYRSIPYSYYGEPVHMTGDKYSNCSSWSLCSSSDGTWVFSGNYYNACLGIYSFLINGESLELLCYELGTDFYIEKVTS